MPGPAADAAPTENPDAPVTEPVADAAVGETPPADATSGAGTEEPKPEATKRSLDDLLDAGEITLEDILSHRKVQGHVGTLAERQAKADRERADREAKEAQLDRAAEEDPDNPLAKERLQTRQAAILGQHASSLLQAGIEAFKGGLPKDVQDKYDATLKGKVYEGEYTAGMAAHLKDVMALAVQHEVDGRMPTIREAVKKELLAEMNGDEPSHDLGQGAPATGGLTRERYLNMSFEERRKLQLEHPDQIDKLNAA